MSTTPPVTPDAERRLDLDWVRIIAFGLLIFYHVASFYWPGTPHNQALSPRGSPWLIVPMLALNPWRLLILFIVSGAATRFMADKMTPRALLRLRNARLAPPLWFVSLAIVPFMGYVAARQWSGFGGDFIHYLGRYFSSIGPEGVNYGHLWFVAYLYVYTVGLIGLLAWAPGALQALQRGLERALQGWGLLLLPPAYLALARFGLASFPQTMNLVWDWYSHAIFFAGFLFGFSLAKSDAIWARLTRIRVPMLLAAVATYTVMEVGAIMLLGADVTSAAKANARIQAAWLTPQAALAGCIYGLDQWLCIAAAFGFAGRYLGRTDGPVRRYLTEAIFPFYIIHELTITVGGYYLAKLRLNLGLEAALLIAATVVSCFATYEIARRVAWLRPLFGLKPQITRPAQGADRLTPVADTASTGGRKAS